ncbi:MAG: hypothetical protein WCO24_01280 [Actinomycetes bacterium]
MRLRWVLVALIALVAIGGSFTQLEAGKSDDVRGTSDCTASNRVTLVVDFGDSRLQKAAVRW